jgi:hypothetical protein
MAALVANSVSVVTTIVTVEGMYRIGRPTTGTSRRL